MGRVAGRGLNAGKGPPPDSVTPESPGSDPLPSGILPPPAVATEWSLDRVRDVLARLGDPHRAYPVLHVAGTNGKGSVASLWAAALGADGKRVGLYTSPHLCFYRERFRVGGAIVSDEALTRAARRCYEAIEKARLTFFEAATVLAFDLFRQEQVDVAVVEVGLGGRLDATNVVEPVLTAVTNVAVDHAEYLGTSLEEIAREKAGILEPGVPMVTGIRDPAALAVLRARAREVGAPVTVVGQGDLDADLAPDHSTVRVETANWGPLELRVPLIGPHQACNAAVAVKGLDLLPDGLRPRRESVLRGVRELRWPGRLQVESLDGVTWVFDVAHNPAGAQALAEALPVLAPPRPLVGLVAVLGDKDWAALLGPVAALADALILTQPPSAPVERRWNPAAVAQEARLGSAVTVQEDFAAALESARVAARGGTVLVTGSNHTVGDALNALGLASE